MHAGSLTYAARRHTLMLNRAPSQSASNKQLRADTVLLAGSDPSSLLYPLGSRALA